MLDHIVYWRFFKRITMLSSLTISPMLQKVDICKLLQSLTPKLKTPRLFSLEIVGKIEKLSSKRVPFHSVDLTDKVSIREASFHQSGVRKQR